jgi:hypothetical protein
MTVNLHLIPLEVRGDTNSNNLHLFTEILRSQDNPNDLHLSTELPLVPGFTHIKPRNENQFYFSLQMPVSSLMSDDIAISMKSAISEPVNVYVKSKYGDDIFYEVKSKVADKAKIITQSKVGSYTAIETSSKMTDKTSFKTTGRVGVRRMVKKLMFEMALEELDDE